MPLPCFALLDDNAADDANKGSGARSRLYTAYQSTLSCRDAAGLPALLAEMQAALQQGLHAVTLFSYELGAELHGMTTIAADEKTPLAEVLLFSQCQRMSTQDAAAWLQL